MTFVTGQIEKFLQAVDRHLAAPFKIIVIGGAAAALAYKVVDFTKDIDTMGALDLEPIRLACEKANKETGLNIPIGPAGVADGPYMYEDRIVKVQVPQLKMLHVFVPEIHDLALMKVLRANANDTETIKQLHALHGLKLQTLIYRFNDEMTHVVGEKRNIRFNLLATIESVFGEDALKEAEALIPETWGF